MTEDPTMELERLVSLARGAEEIDLLLRNCLLVNVLSGRVHPASIAVMGGLVVGGRRARVNR